jgi:RHS repeat-associated protein
VSEDAGDGFVFDSASFDDGSQELLAAHSELTGAAEESAGVQGTAGEQLRQWLPTIPAADTIDHVEGVADEALGQATDVTGADAAKLVTQQQTMLDTEAGIKARIEQIGDGTGLPDLGTDGGDGVPGEIGRLLSGSGDDLSGEGRPGDPVLGDGDIGGDLPGVGGTGDEVPGANGSGDGPGPLSAAGRNPDAAGQPLEAMTTGADPVDVASGDVVLSQADVRLPGVLPLVVQRAHRSSYRAGRWFGRSWASTLDQRLEVTAEGVFFAAADGVVLCYPHPDGDGEPVWPIAGARWPLARDAGGYTVADPQAGVVWRFEPRSGFYLSPDGLGELPLVSVTARPGDRIVFGYSADGIPVSITHGGGYQVKVQADGGRVTSLALAGAGEGGRDVVLARYGYDGVGNLAEVVNSSGLALRMSYDQAGRLTGWQDRNGWSYRYHYDDQGRCVRGEGPGGTLSATFAYDRDRLVTTCTDVAGAVTVYQITGRSQVAAVTDPLGNVTRQDHDRYGRLLSRTDPLGRVTSWSYDGAGNLAAITRPDGSQATADYNELNLAVTVTSPGGATWQQDYDPAGNLTRLAGPDRAVTRYTYDSRGHLASITDPAGATTGVECNAAGLPVAVTGPDGAITRYARDGFGRVRVITGPDGAVTRLGWTIEGRLASRTLPDGAAERFSYDGEGNLVAHLDPAAGLTRLQYGCFDKVAARTGPDGTRTEFGYDHGLRLTSVTHGGLSWRYDYDLAGRLAAESDYNGAITLYDRDGAGQLTGRVNAAGQQVTYIYDVLGNLTGRQADGVVTSFGYDGAGRLIRAASPDAVIALERDAAGRVVAETCNGRTVRSEYDATGRRIRRVTPSGAETRWGYDSSGRPALLQAAGQSIKFGYDEAGREIIRDLPGGAALTQDWDAAGRLAAQVLTGGAGHGQPLPGAGIAQPGGDMAQRGAAGAGEILQRRGYTYRADGYLADIDDLLAGPRRFTLTPAGRVTAVTGPGWAEQYAYDPAGNITGAAWPAAVGGAGPAGFWPSEWAHGPRQHAGTLITRVGGVRYQHDRQGRITVRQRVRDSRKPDTWHYTWDATDRLVAVTTPDGTRWRYHYDPLGRRIAKQRIDARGQVTAQTTFSWDGAVLAEQETVPPAPEMERGTAGDGGGPAPGHVTTWDYRPGTFSPVSQTERHALRDAPQDEIDQRFYAVVTDLIGTPSELTGPDGALAGHQQHTLWGTTTWQPGGASTPLRFPGQYADPETGLHYNNQRYYDPATGSYLSPDPLGLAPALNPHAYVPNPTISLDPLGLMACDNAAEDVPDPMPKYKPSGVPDRSSAVYINVRDADGNVTTVGSVTGSTIHAEDVAQDMVPGGPMSRPFGWRMDPEAGSVTWQPIDVCLVCQEKYPSSLFPSGTIPAPGGAWGG